MNADQPPTTEATRLSAEREQEIRRRVEWATPGPWVSWPEGIEESVESTSVGRFVCHLNSNMHRYRDDSAFIAHAREDVPVLLDEIDALRADTARLTEQVAAAEREVERLNGYIAQLVAGDESEIRALWIMAEHNLKQAAQDSTQAEAALAESRHEVGRLKAELREALIQLTLTNLDDLILPTCLVCGQIGEHADEIIHKPTCVFRTILAAANARADAAGQSRDAYRDTAGRHLDRLAELEEIAKEHYDCPTHIAVLLETRESVARKLAESRHEVGRLREAGMALLPFLHHGSDQAYPCDSIASLPARDCACGLRGKVADLRDLAAASPAPPQEPVPDEGARGEEMADHLYAPCYTGDGGMQLTICGHGRGYLCKLGRDQHPIAPPADAPAAGAAGGDE